MAFHQNECCAVYYPENSSKKVVNRLRHGMRFAFIDMFDDLGKWLVIGILVAGLITAAVPQGFFQRYLGNDLLVMLVMLVISIPLYMCASSSTPLAASLVFAGISPGAALVLLLVGPATNAAGITVVAKQLGIKTAGVYLGGIAVVSIMMGLVLDGIYKYVVQIRPAEVIGQSSEALPGWLRIAGAVLLTAGLLWSFAKQARKLLRGEKVTCPCDVGVHEFNPDHPCNIDLPYASKCKRAECTEKCMCDEREEHDHDHPDHSH
jgi:hypothetical protein